MNETKKMIKVETEDYEYTYTPIYIENEYLSPLLEFKRYHLLRKFS